MANELILIVEDNPKNLKLVRDTLQVKGYRTIEAGTGEEGVKMAREQHPTLVLMDIQLPGMSGIEAFKELRADPRRGRRSPRFPVIPPSAALLAPPLALSHFVGEEIERERAGRLVGVDVLAVELAAAHEQRVVPVQRGAPAECDGHGLGDDLAAKRLGRRTVHRMFSLARIFSRFARKTGKGPDPIFALWHRAPKRS